MIYKITKINHLRTTFNDMEGIHHHYKVYARVKHPTIKNAYYSLKFVFWFDSEDLADFYETNKRISKAKVKAYAEIMAYVKADGLIGFNNNIFEVVTECNRTILKYNDHISVSWYNMEDLNR